jgi:threonine/homoserine/homoserine lactone efflux protein
MGHIPYAMFGAALLLFGLFLPSNELGAICMFIGGIMLVYNAVELWRDNDVD